MTGDGNAMGATRKSLEICFVFERAHGERLAQAERLLRWFFQVHAHALIGVDAAVDGPRRTLYAFARLDAERFGPPDERRVQFWVARAGGRVAKTDEIAETEWTELQRTLAHCDVRAIGVDPADATKTLAAITTAAGLDARRRCYADDRPTLRLDIGGPGWESVRWDDAEESLFVASPLSPPLGDPIPVVFRTRGVSRAAVEWARVVAVRDAADAGPGKPAGFSLGLATSPRELRREIAMSAPTVEYGSRAAPRYSFRKPLQAYFHVVDPSASREAPRGAVAGWVENLSLGGAFVRTAAPAPGGSEIQISFTLPNGARLTAGAVVAFADGRGMGIRFVLDSRSMAGLHDALTLLPAHPRRALVVDDNGLARRMLAEALVERGFDVVTAPDATEGLRVLADELLGLDVLLTDQILPGTLGEELVSTVRRTGGTSELVIAVVTGSPDSALAERLRAAGADLLLSKELGAEAIALKVDAVLTERVMELSATRQREGAKARAAGPSEPTVTA